jgi:hypothetical protein
LRAAVRRHAAQVGPAAQDHHVNLNVGDYEASTRFMTEVLGFG